MEEMVASRFWLLAKENRPKMTLEKVKLLVFGEAEGNWFPHFGLKLEEDESGVDVVAQVEAAAAEILGDISEREYLARRAVGGTMPRLNRVLEEMGIKYGDRKVPLKILKSIEEKASKAAATMSTAARAESKKRKAPSKKHRVAGC